MNCINWAIFSLGTKKLLDVIPFFLFNGGEGKTGDYGETRETTAALNYRPEKAVRPELQGEKCHSNNCKPSLSIKQSGYEEV